MRRKVLSAVGWIPIAWWLTYLTLSFFIPITTFHTREEERIQQAYSGGQSWPTNDDVRGAVRGSFRYTERMTELFALMLVPAEYGVYAAIMSRQRKKKPNPRILVSKRLSWRKSAP